MNDKTRQEEAYEFVASTFVKLLEQDKRISYEHKRSVLAFWEDLFAHEGVRNNMLMAFSALLDEIDKRMVSARKAGLQSAKDAVYAQAKSYDLVGIADASIRIGYVYKIIDDLIAAEDSPEETVDANIDLTEVGGGNEDDTPLL